MPVVAKRRLSPEMTRRVIDSMGGAAATAKFFQVIRCVPYQWMKNGMPDYRFDQIRVRNPELVLDILSTPMKENPS